jgi:hypothetical protein
MSVDAPSVVSTSAARVDVLDKVTGHAKYVDDFEGTSIWLNPEAYSQSNETCMTNGVDQPDSPDSVLAHELGHALNNQLGFSDLTDPLDPGYQDNPSDTGLSGALPNAPGRC